MPAREIYHDDLFTAPIGKVLLDNRRLRLIVFDPCTEVIVQWIP